jgi:glucan phosphoethanolaminetransferase (alkaline phosphatase superfamily)
MMATAVRVPRRPAAVMLVRGLGVATAALLAIDAYVHLHDAHLYDGATGASITQGSLFRVEAVVAIVVALALLVRPHWLVWVVALLVAASAAGAVYLYTYVNVGPLGPLPNMYEPTWALPGKRLAAVAETAATATALLGLAVTVISGARSHQRGRMFRRRLSAGRQP